MGQPCYRSPMASTPATTPTGTRAASPTVGATPATGDVDGRRLRRDRNRDAVVQALLALYREGNLDPSADEIATRSGVSARSVFRYFDDVEDLANAAITHQLMDVAHLLPLTCPPDRPLAERIAAVAQQRAALYEAIFPVAQVSRLRAPFNRAVAARLAQNRAEMRSQVASLFRAELAAMPEGGAARRLAAADTLASYETWSLWRTDQGLPAADAEATMVDALTCLFTAPARGAR